MREIPQSGVAGKTGPIGSTGNRSLRVIVINLERRPDRRQRFIEWNGRQPVRFEFFAAADGRQIDRAKLVASGLLDGQDNRFNGGALGNALSQHALWQACAAGREPFLIFEDDACLRGDFWRHARPMMERYLSAHHMIVFGFNTDCVTALRSSDGFVSAIRFDDSIKHRPDYFTAFAKLTDASPQLFQCLQFWGTLAYAITPAGARALLKGCFPLASRESIDIVTEGRAILPYGLDGMINLALQQRELDVIACYPPLVLGPNSHADSDIQVLAKSA